MFLQYAEDKLILPWLANSNFELQCMLVAMHLVEFNSTVLVARIVARVIQLVNLKCQ